LFIAVVVAAENDGNEIIFGADSSDDDGHDCSEAENDGSDDEDYNTVEVDEDEDEGDERSGRHNQYDPLDVYNGGDVTMTMGPYISFSKEEVVSGPQLPAEKDDDNDDIPILFRSLSILCRGSTAPAPATVVAHPGSIGGVVMSTTAGKIHLGING
jgi:hypothetical protein